ncbi:MAG: hypothetical protein U0167_12420 [bacterium]
MDCRTIHWHGVLVLGAALLVWLALAGPASACCDAERAAVRGIATAVSVGVPLDRAPDDNPCCPDGCGDCGLPCCGGVPSTPLALPALVDGPGLPSTDLVPLLHPRPLRSRPHACDLDRPPRR